MADRNGVAVLGTRSCPGKAGVGPGVLESIKNQKNHQKSFCVAVLLATVRLRGSVSSGWAGGI